MSRDEYTRVWIEPEDWPHKKIHLPGLRKYRNDAFTTRQAITNYVTYHAKYARDDLIQGRCLVVVTRNGERRKFRVTVCLKLEVMEQHMGKANV